MQLVGRSSRTPRTGARRRSRLKIHGRRAGIATALVLVALIFTAFNPFRVRATSAYVGPKHYYLGLGDSLAFGYQPDLDWGNGYVQQWYSNLKGHGSQSLTNYGCNGETSYTFINGGCPYAWALHNYYFTPQLTAAISFLNAHKGQVSPVSLDIGANDLLPDINKSTCAVSATWATDLANVDARLTGTILPQLVGALTVNGSRAGDLVMMNYYDPYQNLCPGDLSYIQTLNQHLAADAAQFNVPVADVFSAFGGAATPNPNICGDTWICNFFFHDIHATTTGYGVIAGAFEAKTGY